MLVCVSLIGLKTIKALELHHDFMFGTLQGRFRKEFEECREIKKNVKKFLK